MTNLPDSLTFHVQRDNWILLTNPKDGTGISVDDWLIRANKIIIRNQPVSDTARDRTQEASCKGYVRARPKREFDLSKFIPQ